MSIGAWVTYFGHALQQRLATALVWLGDVIAFLSRTGWPLVDLLIRIWIGRQALVMSVLISTDWAMAVSKAAGSYPIPVAGRIRSVSEPGVLARRRLVDPRTGDSSRRRNVVGTCRREPHPRGSA